MSEGYKAPFPHCDSRVLHAPEKCAYCDEFPEAQAAREANNIAFTGEDLWPEDGGRVKPKTPCPAEVARPVDQINRWSGNRPKTKAEIDEQTQKFKELMGEVGYPEKEDK